MQTYIKEEHQIFRRALRSFLQERALPNYQQWEEEKEVPRSFWKEMGSNGFLCPWIEEERGGLHCDFVYSVIMTEELERIGTGLAGVSVHSDIVVPYIDSYGSEEQKNKWYPGFLNGESIAAIAMTEPGTGSDLAAIKTTAVQDGDSYIINGEKTFITNGFLADIVIVVCKTEKDAAPHHSFSLLVVEEATPGFKKGKKLKKVGQHANDTAELVFEDARVPASNLLGERGKGFTYLMDKLQQERIIITLASLAAAERMFEITLNYVKQRTAFGKTISSFQNTQFKIAEMATEIQIARTFVDRLIIGHMHGKEIVTEVSMAKWRITELANKVAATCMQLHGGYGYMEEYEIARRYRDIRATTIYAGTNEIMKTIIAKNLQL